MQFFPLTAAGLTLNAPNFSQEALGVTYFEWLTNSMLVAVIVVGVVLWWARTATRSMELIPSGNQNSFEAVVEFLYDMLEGIVGKHMVGRAFSLLATLFIFILFANWFGLIPGVGSIGWGHEVPGHGFEVQVPLLRPTTADLNMTLGNGARRLLLVVVLDHQRSRRLGVSCSHLWAQRRAQRRHETDLRGHLPVCGSYRGRLDPGSPGVSFAATFRQRVCRGDSLGFDDHVGRYPGLPPHRHLYHEPDCSGAVLLSRTAGWVVAGFGLHAALRSLYSALHDSR